MQAILLTFSDDTALNIFVKDTELFVDALDKSRTPTVKALKELKDEDVPPGTIVECAMNLVDGFTLMCSIREEDISSLADRCTQVISCEKVYSSELAALLIRESVLDVRMNAVKQVINNIPGNLRRLKLQQQYINRKAAYIAAMEALVEGCFRD